MIGIDDNDNGSSTALFISIACGYLGLVQLIRYRRRKMLCNLYQQNIDSKDNLDQEVARQILSDISGFEFPLMYRISLEFALL